MLRTTGLPPGPTGAVVPSLDGVSADVLRAGFGDAARVTQARARNFYHGLRLTPEPRRGAIYSIYAWMRAADDLADEPQPVEERRVALGAFRERTFALLAGRVDVLDARTPSWWHAFGATCASYPIDPVIFTDLLAGLEEDLAGAAYSDDAALHRYCYRVAGTAGLACLWIWGLREGADAERARELALRRGQAFQRTNILRDLAQDLDERPARVYVPADVLKRHGMSVEQLRAWSDPEACRRVIADQAALARGHYAASQELESMIDPACSPTLWAMTRIYSGLLDLIEADPSRVVSDRRIRLPGTKKATIAIGAALWAKVGRW
ncbi:MAG: phytoene/squalene synthase family protein [Phycisphaerales bacterium]|nr:phytoene/squalene synthase family protein [Phycisphaerales bacterium]